MKQALFFSLKVWLTSVLLGPLLYVAIELLTQPNYFYGLKNVCSFIGYSLVFGFILSIPSWLLLFGMVMILNKKMLGTRVRKAIITIVGTILSLDPFIVVFYEDGKYKEKDIILWAGCYCVMIIAGIWFYKLKVSSVPQSTGDH